MSSIKINDELSILGTSRMVLFITAYKVALRHIQWTPWTIHQEKAVLVWSWSLTCNYYRG